MNTGNACTMNNVYKVQSWMKNNTVVASFSHEIVPIKNKKKKKSVNLDILKTRPELSVHVEPEIVQSEMVIGGGKLDALQTYLENDDESSFESVLNTLTLGDCGEFLNDFDWDKFISEWTNNPNDNEHQGISSVTTQ